jgi:hypothetical protein
VLWNSLLIGAGKLAAKWREYLGFDDSKTGHFAGKCGEFPANSLQAG